MKDADQFLRIARITGAHGLNGRIKLDIITDILERFAPGNKLYIKIGSEYKTFSSTEFNWKNKVPLLKLENINDRDSALNLKGSEIYTTRSEAESTRELLEENSFYYYDLIGCEVYCDNKIFGKVIDITGTGENSLLVLNNVKGKEFLIPFNDSMVDTKNIFNGRIDINPVDGLFEPEE